MNSSENGDSTATTTTTSLRKLQYPTISPSSKIPNCTSVKKVSDKPINTVKMNTQQNSMINSITSSGENESKATAPTVSLSCRQTAMKPKIPVEGSLMSKSMNSNLPNLIYSKVSNKSKLSINNNYDMKKCMNQVDKKNEPSSLPTNVSQLKTADTDLDTKSQSDKNSEIDYNQQELHLINDLTNDHASSNGYPNDKDLSTYARKIQKRFKDGMQAVKESMQFALSDDDFGDATTHHQQKQQQFEVKTMPDSKK